MRTPEQRSFCSVSNIEFEHVFFCLEVFEKSTSISNLKTMRNSLNFHGDSFTEHIYLMTNFLQF